MRGSYRSPRVGEWRARARTLVFMLTATVLMLAGRPALSAAPCRPASPQSGSNCSKDSQCCAGLVCQSSACRPGCRVSGVFYAEGVNNPANSCQSCQPALSTSSFSAVTNGVSCSDGNACTQTDSCQGGACRGTNSLTCSAQDQCHSAGTCNRSTGLCSNPSKPNGTACDDTNLCTRTDSCQSGVCRGTNPVSCTAQDACHSAGTCDPATGACSSPAKANGTPCSDSNACTRRDTCQAGTCTGSNPVICQSSEQCHDPGTCNPASGACSSPNKADGTLCHDGDACTTGDRCQDGACAGTSVTCPGDACHDAGTCDALTGACVSPPKPDGTACTDGDACTTVDTCVAGICQGGVPRTCQPLQACHTAETCDHTTGQCVSSPLPDGTACFDFNACTSGDACLAGSCHGNPVTCAAPDACHEAGSCDPISGWCSNPVKPDGSTCSDGNACTTIDGCLGGVCTGGLPVSCLAGPPPPCHGPTACDPATGQCGSPALEDGVACDDGVACTTSDTCHGGVCRGSACSATQACCGTSGCLDLGSDNANCGECGHACTDSACLLGQCYAGCVINGAGYPNGARNPGNNCQACNTAISRTAWQNLGDFNNHPFCSEGCASGGCVFGVCNLASPGGGCPSDACASRSCNGVTCTSTPINEGGACTPALSTNSCKSSVSGTCNQGACIAVDANEGGYCRVTDPITTGNDRDCRSRVDGTCVAGSCSPQAVPNGTTCSWHTSPCVAASCVDGICPFPHVVTCFVPQGCGASGTCDPATNQCGNYPGPFSNELSCGSLVDGWHPEDCCPGQECRCPPFGFCSIYYCY